MRKLLVELLVLVFCIGALWLLMSKINWMSVFRVEKATQNTEVKIGEMFWNMMKSSEKEINTPAILLPLDSILDQICSKNKIDRATIKFHLLHKEDINAFSLPDNHLVVFSGLVNECENESELAGVLCHELAHLKKKHIMNKLVKEFGLSILISASAGNGSSGTIREALKQLSSSAYDRKLESEADMTAVEYLMNAEIDPEPFANFLYRLSDKDKNLPTQLQWISNHPDSKDRAGKIIKSFRNRKIIKTPILGESNWKLLKKHLSDME